MAQKRHHTSKRRSAEPASLTKSILLGLGFAAGTAVILLLIFTAIVYSTPDPGKFIMSAALAAVYISAFTGGFASSYVMRGATPICGGLTGGAYWLLLLVLSLIIPGIDQDGPGIWASVGLHALLLPFALLGSAAGANLATRKQRRPKRR